jgi:predicted lipoprotein with Yx(FWY)xxD motif
MRTRFATGLAAVTLAVLLAGCTGGGDTTEPPADTGTTEETPDATTPGAGDALLMTADSDLGEIVVDADGMTVYMFDNDTQDSDTSTCEGDCATNWPAVTTDSEEAPAVEGVTGEVGTITGVDGETQVTLNGWPLYYFAGDSAAGDTNGQGQGGIWWVLDPAGEKISG